MIDKKKRGKMKLFYTVMLAVLAVGCGSKALPVSSQHKGLASCAQVTPTNYPTAPVIGVYGRNVAWTDQEVYPNPDTSAMTPATYTEVQVRFMDTGSTGSSGGSETVVTPPPYYYSVCSPNTLCSGQYVDDYPSYGYNGGWLTWERTETKQYFSAGYHTLSTSSIMMRNLSTSGTYIVASGSPSARFLNPSSSPFGMLVYQRDIVGNSTSSIDYYDLKSPQRYTGGQISATWNNGHYQANPRTDGTYIVYQDLGPYVGPLYSIPVIKLYNLVTDTVSTIGYGYDPDVYSDPTNYAEVVVWVGKDGYGHDQVYGYDIEANMTYNYTSSAYDKKYARVSYDADNGVPRVVWSEKNANGDFDVMVSPGNGEWSTVIAGGDLDQVVGDVDGDMVAFTSSGNTGFGFVDQLFTYTLWDTTCSF